MFNFFAFISRTYLIFNTENTRVGSEQRSPLTSAYPKYIIHVLSVLSTKIFYFPTICRPSVPYISWLQALQQLYWLSVSCSPLIIQYSDWSHPELHPSWSISLILLLQALLYLLSLYYQIFHKNSSFVAYPLFLYIHISLSSVLFYSW